MLPPGGHLEQDFPWPGGLERDLIRGGRRNGGAWVCVCVMLALYMLRFIGNKGLALVTGTWQNEKWPKGVGKRSCVGTVSPSLPPSLPPSLSSSLFSSSKPALSQEEPASEKEG